MIISPGPTNAQMAPVSTDSQQLQTKIELIFPVDSRNEIKIKDNLYLLIF
jgi:hypothetical protein